MRKLNIQDAFALARIIKSADIKDEIAEFAELSLDKIEIGACHHEHH